MIAVASVLGALAAICSFAFTKFALGQSVLVALLAGYGAGSATVAMVVGVSLLNAAMRPKEEKQPELDRVAR
ncbi:MAG: hypothetical protein AAF871_14225 [Pseudomonadota bacterium]